MALRIRFAVLAVLGVFAVALGAAPASAAPAGSVDEPTPLCLITTSTVAWSDGYQADITIKNVSSVRVTWQATLTPPSGSITAGWNATFTRFGGQYVIDPPSHAPILGPAAIVRFGYTGKGSPGLPTVTCTQVD